MRFKIDELPARYRQQIEATPVLPAVKVPAPTRMLTQSVDAKRDYVQQLALAGLPEPQFEYQFDPARRWRADYAWPDLMVLAEYEGGVYQQGRHTRGAGFEGDCEKYSRAAILGFCVIRFTYSQVLSGLALQWTEAAIDANRRK